MPVRSYGGVTLAKYISPPKPKPTKAKKVKLREHPGIDMRPPFSKGKIAKWSATGAAMGGLRPRRRKPVTYLT
jgi:hypothetical protein